MSQPVTRRQLLASLLPSRAVVRLAGWIGAIAAFCFLAYVTVCFFSGLTVDGGTFFLAIFAALGALALAGHAYRRLKAKMREHRMTRSLTVLQVVEHWLNFSILILFGAILYRIWIENPTKACIAFALASVFYLSSRLRPKTTEAP